MIVVESMFFDSDDYQVESEVIPCDSKETAKAVVKKVYDKLIEDYDFNYEDDPKAAQQEFEVAKLEAAKAEEVARKVRAEGEAKAAANRALVAAGLTPLEAANIKKETAIGIAQALAKSEVSWVPRIMFTGNGNNGNAMDAVGLKMLMDIADKLDK